MVGKAKKLFLLAASCLPLSLAATVVISIGLIIPFVGIALSIIAAIRIARFIEGNRKENFPGLNRFIYILCTYGPGFAALAVLLTVGLNLPDHTGYARLIGGVAGSLVFISQLIMTITGTIIILRAPRISFLPRVTYYSDIPDPESFFNNNGG